MKLDTAKKDLLYLACLIHISQTAHDFLQNLEAILQKFSQLESIILHEQTAPFVVDVVVALVAQQRRRASELRTSLGENKLCA